MSVRDLVRDRRLVAALRVGLGILFVAASLPKLADPYAFAKSVANYRMLPEVAERALALLLPPLELVVGVCLVAGVLDAGAALLALAMMLVFTTAVGTALARGLDISCGCFDTDGGTKVGLAKIAENVALTVAAFHVWRNDRGFASLGRVFSRVSDIE